MAADLAPDVGDDVADGVDEPPPPGRGGRARGERIGWIAGVVGALVVLGSMWTLATPVGSSPDDGFHLASIWCSPTAPAEACTDLGDAFAAGKNFVEIPAEVGPQAHCFAYDPRRSAACVADIESGTRVETIANDGIYPGLFHSVLGLAVTDQPANSALIARMLAWTLNIGLLAAAAFVLHAPQRPAFLLVLLVTSVPHGVFLFASTNPSGLVIAAVAAAWCSVVALSRAEGTRSVVPPAVLLGLSVLAAAGSRADGGLYAFIAIAAAIVLLWRSERPSPVRAGGIVVAALLGLAVSLIVASRRLPAIDAVLPPTGSTDGASEPLAGLLFNNLREIPYFITGNLGLAPSGWLDIPMPRLVWAPTLAAFAVLTFWGIGRMSRAKALSLAIVLAGLLLIPFVLLWRGRYPVGFEVQPRYVLPLMLVLGVTALYRARRSGLVGLSNLQVGVVLVGMTVAHAVSLHTHIRRYVTGVEVLSVDLDSGREWWWDIPITPNMVWITGSIAFAALAALLGAWLYCGGIDDLSNPTTEQEPVGNRT